MQPTKTRSRAFRPTLLALEPRLALAAPEDVGFVGPVAPPIAPPFDTVLNVNFQTAYSGGPTLLEVDGSYYDDEIPILTYRTGSYASITLQLKQYSNRVLISNRTATYHAGAGGFNPSVQVKVFGKGGDDVISNQTNASMDASGGVGVDHLIGGTGSDILFGNDGEDYLNDSGGFASMSGGSGNDTLFASSDGAVMSGGSGNDYLYGGRASDSIYGNTGDDVIVDDWSGTQVGYGDNLIGDDGNDTIRGSGGDDAINGLGGNDFLDGAGGNDTVRGGDGNDLMYGGAGSDTLLGQWGKDELHGGLNDDYLDAGYWTGNSSFTEGEILYGDHGSDTFVRHISVFWGLYQDDSDVFADYNVNQWDRVENTYHW